MYLFISHESHAAESKGRATLKVNQKSVGDRSKKDFSIFLLQLSNGDLHFEKKKFVITGEGNKIFWKGM